MLAYYSNLVLGSRGAHRTIIWFIALTEIAVCTVMHFPLATRDESFSNHRHTTALQVGHPVILLVPVAAQEIVDQICFVEILRFSA